MTHEPRQSALRTFAATAAYDVRHATRSAFKQPAFAVLAILTLALGIGATTAILSVVEAAYFSRYPLRDPDRLVRVYGEDRASGSTQLNFSYPRFLFFRDHQTSFESFAAVSPTAVTIGGPDEVQLVSASAMTSDFLTTFGAQPVIGRFIRPDEETGGRVVVLGERLWRVRYNADSAVTGRAVTLSGTPYTVVGVAPQLPAFWDTDVWLPDPFVPPGLSRELMMRGVTFLNAIGRLKTGVTPAQANEEMQRLAVGYRGAFGGNADAGWVASTVGLRDDIVGAAQTSLLALTIAVAMLLVVACANVANLLLVRFMGRRQEIGVRAAMGASRARILRHFLLESILTTFVAAAAGAALAYSSLPTLVSLAGNNLAFAADIQINGPVLAASAFVALVAGLIMGVYPALQATRTDVMSVLRDGGRTVAGGVGSERMRRTMIAAQVTVSLVLLVGASSLVASFVKLRSQPPGFNPANLFVGGVNLQAARYRDPVAQHRLYVELNDALRAAPGVAAAVVTQAVPLVAPYTRAPYAGASGGRIPPLNERPLGLTRSVMPGHFSTLGIPLLAGRDFTERDTADAPLVAVVSRATARRLFPDDEVVLGRRIIMGSLGGGQVMEIVGVVGDVRSQTLASVPPVEFYRPAAQRPLPFMRIVVRTRGDAAAFEPTARAVLRRIDPQLPLVAVTTAQQVVDRSLAQERLLFMLLAVFAGLAMVLSAIGIYGVVAQYVSQRRVEIAVRIALGARGRTVLAMIVRQSLRPVVTGLACGALALGALSPFLQRLLFEVSALNPTTMAGAAAGLLSVALAACLLPAVRATRIEPTQVLKG